MTKKAVRDDRKQQATTTLSMNVATQQLMLPLLLAMDATKKGLLAFVQQMGMAVLTELLASEAAAIAGPKGKHASGRTHHHWGTKQTPLCFGGRNVSIERPRVRARGKGKNKEVELPTIEALREGDPLSARVAEQIVLGVSTRGYERSLDPIEPDLGGRGASKSNASRALIDATAQRLATFASRKLDDVDLVAMFIDGIEFKRRTVIVALGVTIDGTKVPLGLWGGSTENASVATSLLNDLVERGLRVEESMLFVIDGGKGLRKALRDVFGDRAIVQRCQVHKSRNVREHLPEARRGYVARQMRDAYASATVATAKKKLLRLASWLESNGEDSAAPACPRPRRPHRSRRGTGRWPRAGVDPPWSRAAPSRALASCSSCRRPACARASTRRSPRFDSVSPRRCAERSRRRKAIENMNGTIRRVTRNVTRWRDEATIRRWIALSVAKVQRGFRRVKGYRHMPALVAALRPKAKTVASEKKGA